jgi:hypothetical protein
MMRLNANISIRIFGLTQLYIYYGLATRFGPHVDHHWTMHTTLKNKGKSVHKNIQFISAGDLTVTNLLM